MEAQGFLVGARPPHPLLALGACKCTPPTQDLGLCWASGFKKRLGAGELQQGNREGPCDGGCDGERCGRLEGPFPGGPPLPWLGVWTAGSDETGIKVSASPHHAEGHTLWGWGEPPWLGSLWPWLTTPASAPWAPRPLHAAASLPRRRVETRLLSPEPRSSLTWPSDGAAPGSLSEPPASGPGPSRKLDGTRPRCPFSSPWGGDAGETDQEGPQQHPLDAEAPGRGMAWGPCHHRGRRLARPSGLPSGTWFPTPMVPGDPPWAHPHPHVLT